MKLFILFGAIVSASVATNVNLDSFRPIIQHVNSLNTTWKADPNIPDHVTISSFKKLMGVKKRTTSVLEARKPLPDVEIPEEFDAREQWPECPSIGQIRDQGNCGSCWAVAAAGAFTDRLCIKKKGNFTTPLSSEELTACCDSCGMGCNGGFPDEAWRWFSIHGLVTGGEYGSDIGCQPYSLQSCEHHTKGSKPSCDSLPDRGTPYCQRKCTNSDYCVAYKKDHHRVAHGYSLAGEGEIQKEIIAHGPVEATFSVYSDFVTYKSGVYKYTTGSALGGHAVRIIGWGTENGTPYWLVANSWNEDWGDKGFFKILRGHDECGIESEITAGIPS